MEYLSFWLIYILIWYNLCIFWVNGKSLRTIHSKIAFWDSLEKNWLIQKIFFRLSCVELEVSYLCWSEEKLNLSYKSTVINYLKIYWQIKYFLSKFYLKILSWNIVWIWDFLGSKLMLLTAFFCIRWLVLQFWVQIREQYDK